MNAERIHAARRHAKARASARLGVVLNSEALREVVADIQAGRSLHIYSESNDRRWHLVLVKGAHGIAVYGRSNKTVHTFLTVEMAQETLAKRGATDALARLGAA